MPVNCTFISSPILVNYLTVTSTVRVATYIYNTCIACEMLLNVVKKKIFCQKKKKMSQKKERKKIVKNFLGEKQLGKKKLGDKN